MGRKSSLKAIRLYVYLPIFRADSPDSEFENFYSPNYIKFVDECDRSSKISQNVPNLFFFGKIDGFFRNKLDFFSKSPKVANLL